MLIAMLFQPTVDFELFETEKGDFKCAFDQITAGMRRGSKGARTWTNRQMVAFRYLPLDVTLFWEPKATQS
jgi:hypothetical protein